MAFKVFQSVVSRIRDAAGIDLESLTIQVQLLPVQLKTKLVQLMTSAQSFYYLMQCMLKSRD